jgi:hypothetical protein
MNMKGFRASFMVFIVIGLFFSEVIFHNGILRADQASPECGYNELSCNPGKKSTGKQFFYNGFKICCDEKTICVCCFSHSQGNGCPVNQE